MEDEEDDIEIVMEETSNETYQKPITVISTGKSDEAGAGEGRTESNGGVGEDMMSLEEGRSQDGGRSTITKTLAVTGHLDMSAILYEGKSIFNVDLDTFEDKPWRKPGVDITDYFNYGFDENLWRLYCQKHKTLRDDNLLQRKINVYEGSSITPAPLARPSGSSANAPRYGFQPSQSGGTIPTLGSNGGAIPTLGSSGGSIPTLGSSNPIPTLSMNASSASSYGRPVPSHPFPNPSAGGHLPMPPPPPHPSMLSHPQSNGPLPQGMRIMPPPPPHFSQQGHPGASQSHLGIPQGYPQGQHSQGQYQGHPPGPHQGHPGQQPQQGQPGPYRPPPPYPHFQNQNR